MLEIIKCQQDKKHLLLNVGVTSYDFQFQKKSQIPGIIESIQFAQKLQAKANAGSATASPAVTGKGPTVASPLVVHAPSLVKSPTIVQSTTSPVVTETSSPVKGPAVVTLVKGPAVVTSVKSPTGLQTSTVAKAPSVMSPSPTSQSVQMKPTAASTPKVETTKKSQPRAIAIYEYTAQTEEEISMLENEEFIVLDTSDPDWTLVELTTDSSVRGLVPASYIERLIGDHKSMKSPVHLAPESPKNGSIHPPTPLAAPLPPRNVEPSPIPSLPSRNGMHVPLPPRNVDFPPESSLPTEPSIPSRHMETDIKSTDAPPSLPLRNVQPSSPVKTTSNPPLPQRSPVYAESNGTTPVSLPPRSPISPVKGENIVPPPRPPRNEPAVSVPPPRPARNEELVNPVVTSALPPRPARNDVVAVATVPKLARNEEPPKQELTHSHQSESAPPPRPARTSTDIPPPRQPHPSSFTTDSASKVTADSAPKAPLRISSHEEKPPTLASRPTVKTEPSPTPSSTTAVRSPGQGKILRMWTDRSGSFKVEAHFIGFVDGKVQLHKVNGVKIAVPIEKLCQEDFDFIKSLDGEKGASKPVDQSAQPVAANTSEPPKNSSSAVASSSASSSTSEFVYNKFDWLAFLLDCGVFKEDAKTYARTFVKENMDLATLPHLDRDMLKDLNVASGDVIRIIAKKPMSQGYSSTSSTSTTVAKPITDTSFFDAVSTSSTTKKSTGVPSVSSLFEDPAVKAKILEAEKQAQQKNLDILLGKKVTDNSPSAVRTQVPVRDLEQQMAEDQRLAMELQERELRAAGMWKDNKKAAASSTSKSSKKNDFTDGSLPWPETFTKAPAPVKQEPQVVPRRTSRGSAPASTPMAPTVNPTAVFEAAKVLSRSDSNNDLSGARRPSSMVAPLIPTPSSIVPMAVNISTGDPPRPVSMNAISHAQHQAPMTGIAQQPQVANMGIMAPQQQTAFQSHMQRNPSGMLQQPQMQRTPSQMMQQSQIVPQQHQQYQQHPQMMPQQSQPQMQQGMAGMNVNQMGSSSYGNPHMLQQQPPQQQQQQQWPGAMQQNIFSNTMRPSASGSSINMPGMGMAPMNQNPMLNMAPLAPLGFPPMPNLLPTPMMQMGQPQDDRYSVFKDLGGQPMNGGFTAPMNNSFEPQRQNQAFPPTNHQPQGYRPQNQNGWM